MSSTSSAPDWLQSALGNSAVASDEFREQEPVDLLPGDIVVVGPYDDASACGRLLIVVDVDKGYFHGMLAIPETEFATSVDAVLTPESTGLGYDIAVLTRFHGPIWSVQVRHRVGAIELSDLEELERLMWNDEPSNIALLRGQLLQPEGIDPSYSARRVLSLEFDALTEHYRRRCRDLLPILDPLVGEFDTLNELLCEPGWKEQIESASISAEFRDRFLDSYPNLSPDQQRAAQLIGELTQQGRTSSQKVSEKDLDITGHKDKGSLVVSIGQIQETLPFLEVLTHPKCWEEGIPPSAYATIDSERTLIGYTSLGEEPMKVMA